MLPRPSIPLTPEDQAVGVKWSCRMLSIWAVIVIATLTLPIFRVESANVSRGQARDHAAVRSEFSSGSVHHHFTNDPAVQR
jgi:hypothetical protein